MNQADESEAKSSVARYVRVGFGIIYLSFATLFTVAVCYESFLISPALSGLIFAAYLLGEGILMTWLSALLYRQHGIEKFRFGIGALLILTTMLAILLGCQSLISSFSKAIDGETNRVLIYLFFWWILSLAPVLFIAEAVLMFIASRRRRRHSGNRPGKEREIF